MPLAGEWRARIVVKQHPPASGSTLGDIHAILRGAFRFGVRPYSPTKMSHVVSDFFAALGMPFTAKSLRAFAVTNWRKARVPDDATPVTDRHYHYRDEVADRQETDQLVGPLLYAAPDRDPDPSPEGAQVISLHAVRAARRSG